MFFLLFQTAGFFVKDQIKQFLLSSILNVLMMNILVAVIHWGGEYFYWYAGGTVLVFILLLMSIYPDFIAPLFDKVCSV
jgi:STE24 endopeptidase